MIVIDEISMMGCTKFVELDSLLRKVKKKSIPFGGLDIFWWVILPNSHQ